MNMGYNNPLGTDDSQLHLPNQTLNGSSFLSGHLNTKLRSKPGVNNPTHASKNMHKFDMLNMSNNFGNSISINNMTREQLWANFSY
jgi:hypothetical protein